MSISLYSTNAKFFCNHEFNQNLHFPLSFQFHNHRQLVDFPPNHRLSAAIDQKRSPYFAIHGKVDGDALTEEEAFSDGGNATEAFTCVMKFGGSSVASAERIREVANLIQCFPEEKPIIVLSAMGKTTNNLICAGEQAVSCGFKKVSEIEELSLIKELHLRMVTELGIDGSVISGKDLSWLLSYYFFLQMCYRKVEE